MKKVLITGGSGLLGQYLNIKVSSEHGLLTTYNTNTGNCKEFSSKKINILDKNELQKLFAEFNPDVVIHSAAITNPVPKENQTSKDYFSTNVTATERIAQLCAKFKSKIIYISTDLVYAGYRGSFLKEDAKLIPASLYAETKLVGETKVKESTENYLILRTSLLYGFGFNHSQCHFQQMFNDLQSNKLVKLFIDQFRTPISLKDASRINNELVEMDIKGETINLGGLEKVSRYELGEILCSIAGLDRNLLHQIKMNEIPNYPVVEDVSLNTDKLQLLGLKPRSIEENIVEIIRSNS
jgi:dTDP-4-dehydrorhamnose reductase